MILSAIKQFAKRVAPPKLVMWHQANYAKAHGEAEMALLPALCDRSKDSIDVGANEGVYSHALRNYSRQVIAFEAVKPLADDLRRKLGNSVTVHNVALSNRTGTARLHVPVIDGKPATGLSSLRSEHLVGAHDLEIFDVPTAKLDDLYRGDLGFIKIDVEGHEDAVLEGTSTTITRCRPTVLIEAEERHRPGAIAFLRHYFAEREYCGFFLHNGQLVEFAHFELETMQNPADIAQQVIHASRRSYSHYVNNFIFVHRTHASRTRLAAASLDNRAGAVA